jgi:hypothetical protein
VSERQRWNRADELDQLDVVQGRTPSEHLDGVFDRTVLVNASARSYRTLSRSTVLPSGALVVQRHHLRGEDATAVYFVMERLPSGNWTFLVVDRELRVAAAQHLERCARCHADAPYNGLFGVAAP